MKKNIIVYILFFLIGTLFVTSANEKFVVVIDPGHGGRDAGAIRGSYKEKDINLSVALTLGKLIESNMKNVKVVYTRKSDVFVDLYKRTEIANKAKANLFISIHTNSTSAKTTAVEGADTYILGLARSEENLEVAKRENSVILLEDDYTKRYEGFDPKSPESYIIFEFMTDKYMEQSLQFASSVQKGFANVAKRKDRGVRQAGFLVLRESAMPSVLIELGFINNTTEARYLASATGQRSMASSIFTGLEKYINDFVKKQGSSTKAKNIKAADKTTSAPSNAASTTKTTTPKSSSDTKTTDNAKSENKKNGNNNDTPFVVKNIDPTKEQNKTAPISTGTVSTPSSSTTKSQTSTPATKQTEPIIKTAPASTGVKSGTVTDRKSNIAAGTIEYRVQFLMSPSKLSGNSPKFKGLSPVDVYEDGGAYKYTYGSTVSEREAVRIRNEIRAKFKDAFVVKFRDGIRVK